MDSIDATKKLLRERTRRDRELGYIPESWKHILNAEEIRGAQFIASYISYGVEPETADLNRAILSSKKTLLLPRTLKNKEIEWVVWDGNQASLQRNSFTNKKTTLLEPQGPAFTDLGKIEVVIVPSLLVDRHGVRLGQGGGSYDRALAKISPWTVGLVYGPELTGEDLPRGEHDQTLDAAATPHLLVRFSN